MQKNAYQVIAQTSIQGKILVRISKKQNNQQKTYNAGLGKEKVYKFNFYPETIERESHKQKFTYALQIEKTFDRMKRSGM